MNVGDTLKAKGQPTIRLVGVDESTGSWIVENVATYGSPYVLDARALAVYAADPPSIGDRGSRVLARDREANDKAWAAYQGAPDRVRESGRSEVAAARRLSGAVFTPEERFDAIQAEEPLAAERVAQAIARDPARLEAVAAGQVPIHEAVLRHLQKLVDDERVG